MVSVSELKAEDGAAGASASASASDASMHIEGVVLQTKIDLTTT